jgi:hypothetical protein
LYVPQPGRLEVIVCVLYVLPTHGFCKPLETFGRQFGHQSYYVLEVVSGRTVRNTCSPRTGAQRERVYDSNGSNGRDQFQPISSDNHQ